LINKYGFKYDVNEFTDNQNDHEAILNVAAISGRECERVARTN